MEFNELQEGIVLLNLLHKDGIHGLLIFSGVGRDNISENEHIGGLLFHQVSDLLNDLLSRLSSA